MPLDDIEIAKRYRLGSPAGGPARICAVESKDRDGLVTVRLEGSGDSHNAGVQIRVLPSQLRPLRPGE